MLTWRASAEENYEGELRVWSQRKGVARSGARQGLAKMILIKLVPGMRRLCRGSADNDRLGRVCSSSPVNSR